MSSNLHHRNRNAIHFEHKNCVVIKKVPTIVIMKIELKRAILEEMICILCKLKDFRQRLMTVISWNTVMHILYHSWEYLENEPKNQGIKLLRKHR